MSFLQSEGMQELILFFQHRLTLLDFVIIGLGSFLLIYQLVKRISTFSTRFRNHAQEDALFLTREELKLGYISSLIEILPMLGIMGTVWGLMNALFVISSIEMPTIRDIATHIAPALSTTFFGLLFATINLILFNYLHAYYTEIIAWCRLTIDAEETTEKTQENGSEQ